MADTEIPYWCYNLPRDQWPAECPEFLLNLSEREQKLLSRIDEEYQRLTWPEVRKIPYGIDERIVHLVVWTKFDIPDDPDTQELTSAMRQEIDAYVDRTFHRAVPEENVSRKSEAS
ncbi:MAG: hypothetical protein Q9207_004220 [Kuettlingeria erythrocarpa]